MKKTNIAPTVGRETLEEAPERTLKLLRGIALSLPIRAALSSRGYSEADHAEGWKLLTAASGFRAGSLDPMVDVEVRDAVREIDGWDEDGFRIVRASLQRRHPEQAAFLLDGIAAATGPAALVGVTTLLDRLDTLGKSKNKADHAALATLKARGIGEDERKRLRGLLKKAQSAPAVEPTTNHAAAAADHAAALAAVRAWYEEWSEIARACVKRRDYLILLGLAKRKTASSPTVAPPNTPPNATSG
jgi:hypothetical protein